MILRLIIMYIFLGSIFTAFGSEKTISQADSLFAGQKYTEAYEIYEEIFLSGKASASMLLKMAFIKDGLGNYVEALYYLDLYYKKSADKSVVGKIEEISEEKNLSGYRYDDTHFFRAVIYKYQSELQLALIAIGILLTVYVIRKKQQNERPVSATIFQVLTFVALLMITNDVYSENQAIINQNNTLLRSGPSAGAEPVEMIEKGHKVNILDRTNVWTKIEWEGDEVYVRNGRLKVI